MSRYLCIDAGFTRTRFALSADGAISEIVETRSIKAHSDLRLSPDERRDLWLDWLAQTIDEEVSSVRDFDAIGIALPGPVCSDGVIRDANSLWGDASSPLRPEEVSARLGCRSVLRNDLFAAATHYGSLPAPDEVETVLVVSVGSGIGSKLYDRRTGRVISGRRGFEGEIGFSTVDHSADAAQTLDGKIKGTLGLYSSGSGFARMVRAEARRRPEDFSASAMARNLSDAGLDIDHAERFDVNDAALSAFGSGDEFATTLLDRSIAFLARALQIVILFSAPDRVYLTGGFAIAVGDHYRERLVAELSPLLLPMYEEDTIDKMVVLGRSDGSENLRGMASFLSGIDRFEAAETVA